MAKWWKEYLIFETDWNLTFMHLNTSQQQLVYQQVMKLLSGRALESAPVVISKDDWDALFHHSFDNITQPLNQEGTLDITVFGYIQHLFYFKLLLATWSENAARSQKHSSLPAELIKEWLLVKKQALEHQFQALQRYQTLQCEPSLPEKWIAILNQKIVQKIFTYARLNSPISEKPYFHIFFSLSFLMGFIYFDKYLKRLQTQPSFISYLTCSLLGSFLSTFSGAIIIEELDYQNWQQKKAITTQIQPPAAFLGKAFEKLCQTLTPRNSNMAVKVETPLPDLNRQRAKTL